MSRNTRLGILFSGETSFKGSIGRTEDEAGTAKLVGNIWDKLLPLPAESNVYPGHNESSTIGNEKVLNPLLKEGGKDGKEGAGKTAK
jgi:hydroxyacylglutathione hydrolase